MRVMFGRRPQLVWAPSDWRPRCQAAELPEKPLSRDYVYGFNGSCMRSAHLISEEECIYPVASLVVVLKFAENRQRFFEGHTNDVTCVEWNPRKRIVASGQVCRKGGGPMVCIWSPANCTRTICELHPSHHGGFISAVGLSPDGRTAVAFTSHDACMLWIWRDFAEQREAGTAAPSQLQPLMSCSAGNMITTGVFMTASQNDVNFYSVGKGHFKLWSIKLSQSGAPPEVTSKRGIFGGCAQARNPTFVATASAADSAFLTADNGHLYVLSGATATQDKALLPPKSPSTPLGCVGVLPDGRWVAAAGDGSIFMGRVDKDICIDERLAFSDLRSAGGEARAFCSTSKPLFSSISVVGSLALLGTSNHMLSLVNLSSREVQVLQVSHVGEAWAMDFHPALAILATGCSTGNVRFWNVADKRPAVGKVLKAQCGVFSLAFSPGGDLIALGCDKGILEVSGFPSLQPIFRECLSRGQERICNLCFSDDGVYLAACCWDQTVYLLQLSTVSQKGGAGQQRIDVTLQKALTGNASSPLSAMFSADGQIVMSNSKDAQILMWRTKDGSRLTSYHAFRSTIWQTWRNLIGWPLIGLWSNQGYDISDVHSVCQSCHPDEGYVAAGDSLGCVKFARFPNPFLNAEVQTCGGHSSYVTAVKFSRTNMLASLGGDDHSVCLWSMKPVTDQMKRQDSGEIAHAWVKLEADAAPADRFNFLGQPVHQPSHRVSTLGDTLRAELPQGRQQISAAAAPRAKQPYYIAHMNQSSGVGAALRWD